MTRRASLAPYTLSGLRAGDRSVVAGLLNALEGGAVVVDQELAEVVDAAALGARSEGVVVGLTGPPGVGKSTLAGQLVEGWRRQRRSVGVIAVDPSSRASGGALLGDRGRMGLDGRDGKVFVRSMAARDRLGGLAPATELAVYVMRAAWERVLVETVGVGQSETDVAAVADVTVVVVQPGSGDTLQFIKSGLMDVPDVLVVNKSDMGPTARRAASDLKSALAALGRAAIPVVQVCALDGSGVSALLAAVEELGPGVAEARVEKMRAHAARMFSDEYGRAGVRQLGGRVGVERALLTLGGGPLAMLRGLERVAPSR